MATYTLLCGHTIPLKLAIHIAIADTEECGNCCPVCKATLNSEEGFYLAYANTEEVTLTEFTEANRIAHAKRLAERAATPSKPMLPSCSGTCKSGKKCTKSATIASGVYCKLHM
jgi:hypothetical protein